MEQQKSKVYIQIDENGLIRRCEGGYTMGNIQNIEDWIFIDEGFGDRYNLCQSHYFPGGLYTMDGICRFVWDGTQVVQRTEEEIAAELAQKKAEQEAREAERKAKDPTTIMMNMIAEIEDALCELSKEEE